MIRAHIYFSDQCSPLPLLSPPSHSPSHFLSSAPSHLSFPPNTAQTGRWGWRARNPPIQELPILACTLHIADTLAQIPARPLLLSLDRWHTCLPPHLHLCPNLSLSGSELTPQDLSPKMAPRTLHISPAAAQDPGQGPRGAPRLALYVSASAQDFGTFSLHGWGAGSPLPPKWSLLTVKEGNGGGRTIQVQRHGDGARAGGALWRGRVRHLQRRKGAQGRGRPALLCALARTPTPHNQAKAFVLGPARFALWPQLSPPSSP